MALQLGMAIQTVKGTYSLDIETMRALDRLAQRWKVTKSEALRRAIRATAERGFKDAVGDALQALDHLQAAHDLDAAATERWAREAQAERRASSERRVRRRR